MSFLAKIFVDDQEREILNADYLFYKTKDLYGQPTSQALGGQLDIALESTDYDYPWYDWMLSDNVRKKGHIRFYNRDGLSKLFDFEFWDCYCTGLHESFRSTGTMPMTLQLSLSPGVYRIRDYVFEKSWKISEPFSKNKPVTGGNEGKQEPIEPTITRAFVNTIALSPDNDCKYRGYLKNGLGKNCCIELGYYNGVEIQFHFSGSLDGYQVKVTRMLSLCKYENGRVVEKHDQPDGPSDDNIAIRSKIYSIDMPGYSGKVVNVMSGIMALKMIGSFVEMATITNNAGVQIDKPHPVKWHTRLEIRRSSPDGVFKYFEGSIGEGHVQFD